MNLRTDRSIKSCWYFTSSAARNNSSDGKVRCNATLEAKTTTTAAMAILMRIDWGTHHRDKIEIGTWDWFGGSSKREDGGGRCDWRVFVPMTRNTSVATLFYRLNLSNSKSVFSPAKTLDADGVATMMGTHSGTVYFLHRWRCLFRACPVVRVSLDYCLYLCLETVTTLDELIVSLNHDIGGLVQRD